MARDQYQAALEDLRTDVVAMGELVADRLGEARVALAERDEALARSVVEGDAEINDRYLDLEGDCVDLLALQQPVATDLRVVAASFKVITDFERVGDLAVNLGQYALRAEAEPLVDLGEYGIGDDVEGQLRDAVAAYEASDAAACRAIAERDDRVDALCARASESVVRTVVERASDDSWAAERALDEVSRLLLTVRDLERVGDHAVNVAARTLYVAENDPELIY